MRKAFVFDYDDTLAITECKINLFDQDHNLIKKLTPREFSSWTLDEGQYFNFDEFRDKAFISRAEATFLLNLAKEVHDESHSVYILTARESDVHDAILEWFKSHKIFPKTIYCVGGTDKTIAKRKREILLTIMEEYDKCYYYDDCPKNIAEAPEGTNLRKYQVSG